MDIRKPVSTIYGDWITKYKDTWINQIELLKQKFGEKVTKVYMPIEYPTDVPILFIKKEAIIEVLSFLKNEPGFEYSYLADLTATDEEVSPRFNVVYNLYSQNKHWRIRLKVELEEGEKMPSIISVWKGANWAEREIFDMFGVDFENHPDLRRIILDLRWKGHPLRKDYPLRGYQTFVTPEPIDPELLK